jgi:hypothetical protein
MRHAQNIAATAIIALVGTVDAVEEDYISIELISPDGTVKMEEIPIEEFPCPHVEGAKFILADPHSTGSNNRSFYCAAGEKNE